MVRNLLKKIFWMQEGNILAGIYNAMVIVTLVFFVITIGAVLL